MEKEESCQIAKTHHQALTRITRERSRRPRDLVTALDSAMRGSGAGEMTGKCGLCGRTRMVACRGRKMVLVAEVGRTAQLPNGDP